MKRRQVGLASFSFGFDSVQPCPQAPKTAIDPRCFFCGCSPCRVANVVLTAGNYRQMAEWEAMTQAELIDKARKDDPKMLATYATLTERSKRRQALYESKARP